ncbi:MAG: PqqD family protein [Syntrophobacterales bacterium]|nr:MAG: PqqD family protein [Syntrophobacterales bacterium]
MNHLKKSYKKNQDVVFRTISHESILVPIKDKVGDLGFIYNLNDVGTFIWNRIDGKRHLRDIMKMLVDEFDVSPSEAERDLLEFIAHLEKMGIIEVDDTVP